MLSAGHTARASARARAAVQHGVLRGHSARSARRCARTADGAGGSPLLHTRGGARAGGEASEGQLVGPARARAARAWRKGFPARCARGCPQGHARAVTGWALHHSRRPAALRRRLRRRVPTPGCHRAPISERARPSSHPRPAHPSLTDSDSSSETFPVRGCSFSGGNAENGGLLHEEHGPIVWAGRAVPRADALHAYPLAPAPVAQFSTLMFAKLIGFGADDAGARAGSKPCRWCCTCAAPWRSSALGRGVDLAARGSICASAGLRARAPRPKHCARVAADLRRR